MLATVDVYVAPNTGGETFGIILLEAMAAGTPVLASDIDAFTKVLAAGPAAHVRDGNVDDLAYRVVELLGDPDELASLRLAAADTVARYDWARVAQQVLAVYETVIRARVGSARTPDCRCSGASPGSGTSHELVVGGRGRCGHRDRAVPALAGRSPRSPARTPRGGRGGPGRAARTSLRGRRRAGARRPARPGVQPAPRGRRARGADGRRGGRRTPGGRRERAVVGLRAAVDDEDVADLARTPHHALVDELRSACQRVVLARRFNNEAARATLRLRSRPLIKRLRLAGGAPWPRPFEMDDAPPTALV